MEQSSISLAEDVVADGHLLRHHETIEVARCADQRERSLGDADRLEERRVVTSRVPAHRDQAPTPGRFVDGIRVVVVGVDPERDRSTRSRGTPSRSRRI